MKLFGKKKKELLKVLAPNEGDVKELSDIGDEVFSQKLMGDGLAVNPPRKLKKIDIVAPISGKLVTVFPSNHAFGIKANDDKEIFIHIGVDTVNLKGEGFKVYASQNQKIKAGDKLATVNLDFLRKNVPSIETIVIVPSGEEIKKPASGKIESQAVLFKI